MNFVSLSLLGLQRSPVRTGLTLLCLTVAFTLFGLLQGIDQGFDRTISGLGTRAVRLLVLNRVSIIDQLPIAYLSQLDRMPGVAAVTPTTSFYGYYLEPKNNVGGIVVDPAREFDVFDDVQIPPAELAAAVRERTGVIAGRKLATKYGWKVGDRVPLRSHVWVKKDGSADWVFDLVGIYDAPGDPDSARRLFINYAHFDESRAFLNSMTAGYFLRVEAGVDPTDVAQAIDQKFANSTYETVTQSEDEVGRQRLRQLGDVNLVIRSVVGATLVMLLLVTGHVMVQSTSERLSEFATLKALGFSNNYVFFVVLAECTMLTVMGALLGLIIAAKLITSLPTALGRFVLPLETVRWTVITAVVLAILSSLAPALKVRALSIVAALARR
jgi:putative ABC transport system permease protein